MTTTLPPATSEPGLTDRPGDRDDDAAAAQRIRSAVRARSRELKAAHPVLRHQDALGAGILAATVVGVIGIAVAYGTGHLAWWAAVPAAALVMSIAHEIEHDTIHRLYFSRNRRAQDVVFAVVWAMRPYTINPWARRPLHLLHHEVSGTERDIEEKGITNGRPWGLRRLVMMLDPLAYLLLSLGEDDETYRKVKVRFMARAWFPFTYIALAIWYGFLALTAVHLLSGGAVGATGAVATGRAVLTFLAVTWIGPNVLRGACLQFISSNMHYFGDVEEGNVMQQTQVLNRWWLAPAQLFCANFGSTHGIHHFVPNDPFYLRQLTARTAHDVMRENGVRFNDLGTFRRANRLG